MRVVILRATLTSSAAEDPAGHGTPDPVGKRRPCQRVVPNAKGHRQQFGKDHQPTNISHSSLLDCR